MARALASMILGRGPLRSEMLPQSLILCIDRRFGSAWHGDILGWRERLPGGSTSTIVDEVAMLSVCRAAAWSNNSLKQFATICACDSLRAARSCVRLCSSRAS
jgi:hypothetical protein